MEFRLEIPEPTSPTSLKSALEAARDHWLATTPQVSDTAAALAAEAVFKARATEGRMRTPDPEAIRAAVDEHKATIAKSNAGALDEFHTGALEMINGGIAAAVAMATAQGGPVLVSLKGHWEKPVKGVIARPLKLIDVSVSYAG